MKSFYLVALRYYPGDVVAGTQAESICSMGKQYDLEVCIEKISNPKTRTVGGWTVEETIGVTFEKISQTVVSVKTFEQEKLCLFLHDFFRTYQSPRASFGLWGSNQAGERLVRRIANHYD